jgi:uncharacterized protein
MLFIVIARDGTDEDAPSRRAAVRAQHLEGIAPLVEALDTAAARAIFERDVYMTAGVWQSLEIAPFRIAVRAKL